MLPKVYSSIEYMSQTIKVAQFSTNYGAVWCLPNDVAFVDSLKKGLLFENDILEKIAPYITGDGDILDIGSHIGCHTLFYSHKRNPSQKILCFEPQKVIYEICKMNIETNNLKNVEIYNVAGGPYDDTLYIDSDFTLDHYPAWMKVDYTSSYGVNFGGLGLTYKEGGEPVSMYVFDRFLEGKTNKVHFIKMDTEGAENGIVYGLRNLILRDKPILFIEKNTDKNRDPHFITKCPEIANFSFFEYLQSIGYTTIIPFPGDNYLFKT